MYISRFTGGILRLEVLIVFPFIVTEAGHWQYKVPEVIDTALDALFRYPRA